MSISERERARGMLLGLAIGDALGWPVEFLDRTRILAQYGRSGITEPPDPATYTDDTQMSLAVAEALIEAGGRDLNTLMSAMVRHFILWKNDPTTPSRAPGATCIRGVNALEIGAPWREAGVKDSKGCGSCMRVAPVGYFYQHAPAELRHVAQAQGTLTHRHPTADAACIGAAYLVKLAIDDVPPADYTARVLKFAGGVSDEFDAAIQRAEQVLAWPDVEAALATIGPTRGGGWIAEEAVAMALYCVQRHPHDYRAAVTLAANISGDSDSVACIAGGILGARLGESALPPTWLNRLENREYLIHAADRLASRKAEAVMPDAAFNGLSR
jgi:ADP-ribosylglycohydrolase